MSGNEKDATGELRYKILLRAMTEMGNLRTSATPLPSVSFTAGSGLRPALRLRQLSAISRLMHRSNVQAKGCG